MMFPPLLFSVMQELRSVLREASFQMNCGDGLFLGTVSLWLLWLDSERTVSFPSFLLSAMVSSQSQVLNIISPTVCGCK